MKSQPNKPQWSCHTRPLRSNCIFNCGKITCKLDTLSFQHTQNFSSSSWYTSSEQWFLGVFTLTVCILETIWQLRTGMHGSAVVYRPGLRRGREVKPESKWSVTWITVKARALKNWFCYCPFHSRARVDFSSLKSGIAPNFWDRKVHERMRERERERGTLY